jgi:hypothetical protein
LNAYLPVAALPTEEASPFRSDEEAIERLSAAISSTDSAGRTAAQEN